MGLAIPPWQGHRVKVEQHPQELGPLHVPWVGAVVWGDAQAWGMQLDVGGS